MKVVIIIVYLRFTKDGELVKLLSNFFIINDNLMLINSVNRYQEPDLIENR